MTATSELPADGRLRPRRGGGWAAYLPTPTVQCHAANLAWLPGGDLACVWFGGTQEGVADISVHLSRLPAGSDTWLDPVVLSGDPTRSEQNPVLFSAPGGQVWLLYTAQVAGNQDTSEVRRRVSRDGGRSWEPPTVLFPAGGGRGVFVRQPPVVLASGRILVPVFNCVSVPGERWVGNEDTSSVWWSDDGGQTWTEAAVPGSLGCVHMGVVVRQDGSLWASFRSRWADWIWESTSTDDGTTWTEPTPTPLPNNNSSIQAVALGGGVLALVSNPTSAADATERRVSLYDEIDDEGIREVDGPQVAEPQIDPDRQTAFWGVPRAPLRLSLSPDDGRSWPVFLDLETGDGYCMSNNSRDGLNRELSYPSVLPGPDGDLHVAFTYHRRAIKHVHLPADLVAGLLAAAR
ncbi:MAG TPA: exo-alpha-sialidase [Intrasporangium sp.]|uniref:sialidase family protein n=1 Tax=Intrasporangium sp. TaxID=1925024 RepID=UPI002D787D64|nr:exo-alpha-sialidase [Intrasporangium sp.]HET7397844.1 exo-alpha-sialidase [Intrasporangium sp.]